MKDAVMNTKILTYIAVIAILGMVIWGAVSWSQNHTFDLDYLLYATLGAIFGIFIIRSFTHPLKDKRLFKIINMWVRNRHLNRVVAYLFLGVLVFGVNSKEGWVQTAHLIFTGSAIVAVYINLLHYYENRLGRGLSVIGTIFGVGGFIGSWFFDYTIAAGEMLAATPVIIWVLLTTKKEK